MTLFVKRTLEDGATVLGDNHDPAWEAVLPAGQWQAETAGGRWPSRERVDELVAANSTAGQNPRSEADEQARETAQNASTGEAHQESERTE